MFYVMDNGYRMFDIALRSPKADSAIAWLVFVWTIFGMLEFLREGALILVLKSRFSWWLAIGILIYAGHTRVVNSPAYQQPTR